MAEPKQRDDKSSKTRILLVDDHAIVRYGMAQVISRQSDLTVCGEEENAARALDAIAALKPDLVIADISLKDSSGLELMRNIKAQYPKLPILVVSAHDEGIYAEIAFRAGALGYLMKEEALEKILTAIRRVLSGAVYVSDALAAKMLQQQIRGQANINESPVKSLSDREMEVFRLVGQWKKTREIAEEVENIAGSLFGFSGRNSFGLSGRFLRKDFEQAFQRVDAIVTPTAPTPAFKLGEKIDDPVSMYLADIFTVTADLAGVPGISVPCGNSREGLPIGLQIVSGHARDALVLRAAAAYERVRPIPAPPMAHQI